jgi:hypothetical protein
MIDTSKKSVNVTAGINATIDHYNGLRADMGVGWLDPQITPTYNAVSGQVGTINVPTNATTLFEVGDKIRFKQGGAYLYFYVTAVTATTLSITGGSEYTLTNAGITDFYMSKWVSPVDWPLARNILITDADAATITFDINASLSHIVTLGGNRTLAVANVKKGDYFAIHLKQDGSTRTVTWWGSLIWYGGAPTLSTATDAVDSFVFWFDGTNYYGAAAGYGAV